MILFSEGFLPDLDGLPLYLLRLASEVDWSSEKECFHNLCHETARFYVLHPWKQQCSDTDDISVICYKKKKNIFILFLKYFNRMWHLIKIGFGI